MSGIITDNIGRSSGLVKAAGGGGKIGQVVSVTKDDTASGALGTSAHVWHDTGLTVDITPAATSSEIWLSASLTIGCSIAGDNILLRFVRDSTAIGLGAAAGDRTPTSIAITGKQERCRSVAMIFQDNPASTSTLTYKIEFGGHNNGGTIYLNRSNDDLDYWYRPRAASNLTAMEVLA